MSYDAEGHALARWPAVRAEDAGLPSKERPLAEDGGLPSKERPLAEDGGLPSKERPLAEDGGLPNHGRERSEDADSSSPDQPRAPRAEPWELRVPFGARGELAEVEIEHVSPHRRVGWARLVRILEPSPFRVLPHNHEGHRCGGCSFAHISHEERLWAKGERLGALAARFPEAALSSPWVRPSNIETGYRNRGKYVIGLSAPTGPHRKVDRDRGSQDMDRRRGSRDMDRGRGSRDMGRGRGSRDMDRGRGSQDMGRRRGSGDDEPSPARGRRLVLGGYLPRSHEVTSTLGCPVMEPAVDRAAAVLESLLAETRLSVYDEGRGQGLLRYAAIRSNHQGEVLVTLVTTADPALRPGDDDLGALVAGLRERVPGLVGVTLDVNPTRGNVLFSGQGHVLYGVGSIWERYGPARVGLTGHGFGQVNRDQAAAIYAAASEAALAPLPDHGAPRRIWELYSGAGALAQTIALGALDRGGARVLGVERDEAAVRLGNRVASELGLSAQLSFLSADASAALMDLGARGRAPSTEGAMQEPEPPGAEPSGAEPPGAEPSGAEPPEVVVLDPPRAGCRPPLLEALCRLSVPRVVYVSCDPESLGRDLGLLEQGGYQVRSLAGFDMMPLTPHLEVLCVVERVAGR